jgi:hypothetical protein
MKRNGLIFHFVKYSLAAAFAALAFTTATWAAVTPISVGPTGTGVFTFDTQPTSANGWTTLSVGTYAGTITNSDQLDAAVQLSSAADVTAELGTSSVYPPSVNAIARWNYNANGYFLQSRPTGNSFTLLMASLQNGSTTSFSRFTVSYNFNFLLQAGATSAGEGTGLYGWRVYYSLTGAAGSWAAIPGLCPDPSGTVPAPGAYNVNVDLSAIWAPGTVLYLLWADDNGPESDSAGNLATEPAYTMDNFSVTGTPAPGPVVNNNLNLPINTNVAERAAVTLSVNMAMATGYQWYKNGLAIQGANAASCTLLSASPTNSGQYYCVGSNITYASTSRTATLTVTPDVIPPYIRTATSASATNVTVNFSEAVTAASATNAANYLLRASSNAFPTGAAIAVSAVAFNGSNAVVLTFAAPRAAGQEYTLFVTGLQDFAYTPNHLERWDYFVLPIMAAGLTPILSMDAIWKYETNGLDLGTAWIDTNYDDSTWKSGPGILGAETTVATVNAFSALGESVRTPFLAYTPQTITYYFRTTFVYSNNPSGLTLISSNYIDDGAVFYLNGQAAGSLRMPNVYNYQTPATQSVEGVLEGLSFVNASLVQGTNTLAVEVHQNNASSSDLVMGLRLFAKQPVPIVITNQPVGTNLLAGRTAAFAVGHAGTGGYQWLFNGNVIPGANAATFTIANATTNDSGNYSVIISNLLGQVTSVPAALVVTADTVPPRLIGSLLSTNSDFFGTCTLVLAFDEPINVLDAEDLSKYSITQVGASATLAVQSAVYDRTNRTVTLTLEGRNDAASYTVRVAGIRDSSTPPNTLVSTQVVASAYRILMNATDLWQINQDGIDLGTAWREPSYDDSAWLRDAGPFYSTTAYTSGLAAGWLPLGWGYAGLYPLQPAPTTRYFRTQFHLDDPAGVQLTFNILAAQGAAFYLNGKEVLFTTQNGRYYLTNGTEALNYDVLAVYRSSPSPGIRMPLYPLNLVAGQNTLAVEVHKESITNTVVAFGLRLIALCPQGYPSSVAPIILASPAAMTTNVGASISLAAMIDGTTNGMVLRWYRDASNFVATSTVTTTTNTVLTLASLTPADAGAYTLVASNAFGSATSSVASVVVTQKPAVGGPASGTIVSGMDYQFCVTASGTAPFAYQWYFAGQPIPRRTNDHLVIAGATTNAEGNYFVVVSNSYGTATSTIARLIVSTVVFPPEYQLGILRWDLSELTGPCLKFKSGVGHTYTLQASTNMVNQADWMDVPGSATSGTGGDLIFYEQPGVAPRKFYRVKAE